jgi:hypothetical protein
VKSNPNSYTSTWQTKSDTSSSGPLQYNLKWVDTTSGIENPRFKTQIAAGQNASTDFIGLKREVKITREPGGRIDWKDNANQKHFSEFSGFYGGGLAPEFASLAPVSSTSASNAALGQFYSNARGAISAMQGMTFLGEIAETIHMIRHPAQGLLKSVDSMNQAYKNLLKRFRGRKFKPAQLQKELANVYLENVFGWLPLVHDIKDGIEAYDRLMGKTVSQRVRGFGNDPKQVTSSSRVVNPSTSDFAMVENRIQTTLSEVIYYGAVRGTATGAPTNGRMADLFGFRLDEFAPTVWELMPWSFLLDYFANIGDIVSAATYVNSNLAWCSCTTRATQSIVCSAKFDRKSSGVPQTYVLTGDGGYGWETTVTAVTRTAYVSPGIPGLQFHLPPGTAQWINIGALLLQSRFASREFAKLL